MLLLAYLKTFLCLCLYSCLQVKSLEAQLAQSKSSASYYQQLAQETQTSLDEARHSLAEAEEALVDARRQIKTAAAAASQQQHQQQQGYGAVQQSSSGAQQQQQQQQRCELLEMQLGKLQVGDMASCRVADCLAVLLQISVASIVPQQVLPVACTVRVCLCWRIGAHGAAQQEARPRLPSSVAPSSKQISE
jgi:hypothetical protein